MNIEEYIPFGKENAISRAELSMLTGINDRTIRFLIKESNDTAVDKGYGIVSSSTANGYWKTRELDDIDRYLRESDNRIKTENENNRGIRLLRNKLATEAGE